MTSNCILFQLFISFIKIGSTAFGGGYTVFPLLQKEAVEFRQWITTEELMDMMSVAQILPGVLYVNAATMVGFRMAGFWGALLATIAGILPTLLLTMGIVFFFWDYVSHPVIQKAVQGILVGVVSLIAYSIKKMWPNAVLCFMDFVWVVVSAILLICKANAALVVLGLGGIIFCMNLISIKNQKTKV